MSRSAYLCMMYKYVHLNDDYAITVICIIVSATAWYNFSFKRGTIIRWKRNFLAQETFRKEFYLHFSISNCCEIIFAFESSSRSCCTKTVGNSFQPTCKIHRDPAKSWNRYLRSRQDQYSKYRYVTMPFLPHSPFLINNYKYWMINCTRDQL